jgi:hypothetical protein
MLWLAPISTISTISPMSRRASMTETLRHE